MRLRQKKRRHLCPKNYAIYTEKTQFTLFSAIGLHFPWAGGGVDVHQAIPVVPIVVSSSSISSFAFFAFSSSSSSFLLTSFSELYKIVQDRPFNLELQWQKIDNVGRFIGWQTCEIVVVGHRGARRQTHIDTTTHVLT